MPGKCVLIVDDSKLLVDRLSAMLRDLPNIDSIQSAPDYPTALQRLAEVPVDIVLLDINLPGRSGLDVLRYIKANISQIIVIMLTNQGSETYRIICKKLGADHFIDKSKDFEQVPGIISSLL